jgi:hypothetical protein
MRLAGYFGGRGITEIGVPKPCCNLRADALDKLNIRYSRWAHVGDMKTGWRGPDEIKGTNYVELSVR